MKPLMHWIHQCTANRNVIRDCLKLFLPITGSSKLSGRYFQTDGPTTQKACRPQELSWWHGMTRSCRVADRRCCRNVTLVTERQNSTRCMPSSKVTTGHVIYFFDSMLLSTTPCIHHILSGRVFTHLRKVEMFLSVCEKNPSLAKTV